ncbi:MAG: Rne/Rng family ribonuclease [Jatrophihabitantaceae bacterium]
MSADGGAAPAVKAAPRKRAAKKAAAPAPDATNRDGAGSVPAEKPAPRKRSPKKAAAAGTPDPAAPAVKQPARKATSKSGPAKAESTDVTTSDTATSDTATSDTAPVKAPRKRAPRKAAADSTAAADDSQTARPALAAPSVLFVAPGETKAPPRGRRVASSPAGPPTEADGNQSAQGAEVDLSAVEDVQDRTAEPEDVKEAAGDEAAGARRRRRRGRRGRGGAQRAEDDTDGETDGETDSDADSDKTGGAASTGATGDDTASGEDGSAAEDEDADGESAATKRRRRRRRSGGGGGGNGAANADDIDDPPNTVVHVRQPREPKQKDGDDGVRGVKGSTRLEAKRQRRKDGRDTSRRRPPILTESEFLTRREAVDRVMAVRQRGDRTQIAVLEDNVLVEHYVTRASATSYVGNVYLGRVQNVLPSMEAAFIDISKGRNGVLYAGEVNWDAAGLEGKSRNIESALKSGDVVLIQVTKDPIGHKGARLTSQISLPGRFLVYVPGGGMTGISRKLPDTERHRLKTILKKIVPEDAGVIIRTAAEGATEEELTRDVERLQAQWEQIQQKAAKTSAAPVLVHGEPDLAIRVVRDVFNEDFKQLIVEGDAAWQTVSEYVEGVAPDLRERVERHAADTDLFHQLRVDEQLMKALDRKVWLPSGGSLVIDRTEAMTVIDVNTGKFVGTGGNLEQTVTRNNLEAAEEIVHQLRLRDVGGIVVIDFIDMVLESNRELVLRRLTECLGRDRTKHQVAEVTSLGLVQMTRKRVGEGLLEAFSEQCEHCKGRGVLIHSEPVDKIPGSAGSADEDDRPKPKRKRGGSAAKKAAEPIEVEPPMNPEQRAAALAAMVAIHKAAHPDENQAQAEAAVEAAVAGTAAVEAAVADPDPSDEPVLAQSVDQQSETVDERPEPAVDHDRQAAAPAAPAPRRRRAASRPAGPPVSVS